MYQLFCLTVAAMSIATMIYYILKLGRCRDALDKVRKANENLTECLSKERAKVLSQGLKIEDLTGDVDRARFRLKSAEANVKRLQDLKNAADVMLRDAPEILEKLNKENQELLDLLTKAYFRDTKGRWRKYEKPVAE